MPVTEVNGVTTDAEVDTEGAVPGVDAAEAVKYTDAGAPLGAVRCTIVGAIPLTAPYSGSAGGATTCWCADAGTNVLPKAR